MRCTIPRRKKCSPRRPTPETAAIRIRYFRPARSREDTVAQQRAIAEWSRMSYGWMGRTPDYKASLMNSLGANAEFYGKFADNARAWHKRAQESVLFMNHAIVNPPVDRGRPAEEVKDVYVTIKKETDAGIYVSGAKVVATSSALTHYNFLGQNAATATADLDFASCSSCRWTRRAAGCSAARPMSRTRRLTALPSTIRSRAASTRTTRSSCSRMCSCRGRTCWFTAISNRSSSFIPSRVFSKASAFRAARAMR
jgi:hypothetical protein